MRASEILVNLLLHEAPVPQRAPGTAPAGPKPGDPGVLAIVFGPNLPPHGYYATGDSADTVYQKLKKVLGSQRAHDNSMGAVIDSWILQGFSILMRLTSRAGAQHAFYGQKAVRLSDFTARMMDLRANTNIKVRRTAGETPSNATGEMFGVKEQEKDALKGMGFDDPGAQTGDLASAPPYAAAATPRP